MCCCNMHLFCDPFCPDIKRSPKDAWKCQDIVDLVWIIAPSRANDRSTGAKSCIREDFWVRICHRKDDWIFSHLFDPFWRKGIFYAHADEHISPL